MRTRSGTDTHEDNATSREKELEFDFDHSQIRDPRATPGRVKRPRYEERELSEEFLSKFHIPNPRDKHTDPLYSFYDLHRCHLAKRMKPVAYNKKSMVNGMERHLKKAEEERKKMYDIFFVDGKGPEGEEGST
ncbi:uncharacterized protein BKA55DRAFT_741369 [Fusarium redolens]|uniref:Uncharacterized protein n=1 Tax=Fusarium redolens TaxID=48865 RepID=A0A9P9GIV2_FUSRE|nr:uncharacterized protein BKA55DRAFT_741369 [Fusarium redolens]KAH7240363.1 hypothetical protein BKA55DRAFT_741369 [Fusarium redolens]